MRMTPFDRARPLGLLAPAVLALACGGGAQATGPCATDVPAPECSLSCEPPPATNTCPAGFHCGTDGTCDAACTAGGAECSAGQVCSSDGFCVEAGGPDAAFGPDADCPSVNFTADTLIPTVQLVIDRSGSMRTNFGGGLDRWEAVEAALVDPVDGVVTQLQSQVVFGASAYTGLGTCPAIVSTPNRQLDNLTEVADLMADNYPPSNGETPTGDSLTVIIADFLANPPAAGSPPIIVLATDGEPDTCENGNDEAGGRDEAIAAAEAAYAAGIRLFILSVGSGISISHQQQMANAGVGEDVLTGTAPYFPADTPAALAAAFETIIGGVLSCQLTLDGEIDPSQASAGTVTLNGTPLTFGTDWVAVDGTTIELIGDACDTLTSTPSPTVTANFPCNAVILD
ncbi:MAG: vWA domain-containing protein [Kofleriaceae bacterium]